MNHIQKTVTLPNGKEIHIETGRLAKQADGSVVVRCGDTMMLATVVSAREARDVDFLPLSVDYVEKYAAAGKIPGGFFKREGRLGEHEILTCRLIDRALRPLFPKDYHAETQVIIQLISADRVEQPDALACFAASAALMCSDAPFADPVSEVRVGLKNGEYIVNPTVAEMEGLDMEIMVAATNDSIMMVEGEMNEVSEEKLLEAMAVAHESCRVLNKVQQELRDELGIVMREYKTFSYDEGVEAKVRELSTETLTTWAHNHQPKKERSAEYNEIKATVTEAALEGVEDAEQIALIKTQAGMIIKDVQKEVVRAMTLKGTRLDGRKLEDVRHIWSEAGYLPRTHGSAVFTRGETQALCSVTLGTKLDEQTIDSATIEGKKRFMLHYNFPPYSVGEARFLRGPGRREIGHGNLAERALRIMMPEDYEYTVRVMADILESNGSSSMASVCGGSMALMDAGVPVKAPVSGIAMGLITDQASGEYAVLSDILGDEDFIGDMDFKVAGTRKGLTACQMDIKVRGLSYEILRDALQQSKAGRLHILDKMLETLAEPRKEMSPYAPRIETIIIPTDMIGAVIGPGGIIVQEIQRSTETTVNLEEVGGKGIVTIYSTDLEKLERARNMIRNIIAEPEIGATYPSKVKSIKDFGAFVEFMPGREGLLHISEISYERLESMDGVFTVGQEIDIKLIGIDEKSGKFRLSHKVLLPKPEGWVERAPRERREGGDRRGGERRGGGDRRGGDRRDGGGERRNRDDRGPRNDNN